MYYTARLTMGLLRWCSDKESACQCRKCRSCRFDPCLWVRKIPWSMKWQLATVCMPGKFNGQRNLAGLSPWVYKELDLIERLSTYNMLTVVSHHTVHYNSSTYVSYDWKLTSFDHIHPGGGRWGGWLNEGDLLILSSISYFIKYGVGYSSLHHNRL